MTNQVAVIENETLYMGKPIERNVVVEFAETLAGVHPQAGELDERELRTIAQLALVTGANPLPGTNGIHVWKKDGKLQLDFGIGFWRSQAEMEGGVLKVFRPRPMTDDEREYYGILDAQFASICAGVLKRAAFDLMRELRNEFGIEMSLREAKEELACVGVGTVNPNEYAKKGKPQQWTADKRAEKDMLRQLVPLMNRAKQRTIESKMGEGGLDWSAGEYAHLSNGEKLPDDYGVSDANADLYDDPVDVDIETGEIVEANEEERDRTFSDIVAGNGDDEPGEEGEQLADDEAEMKALPEHSILALRETIKGGTDGKVTLGFVCNRATMTGLYKNTGEHDMSKHAFKAALLWEGWPEDNGSFKKADLHNGSIMPADKGLALFDWLVERKGEQLIAASLVD